MGQKRDGGKHRQHRKEPGKQASLQVVQQHCRRMIQQRVKVKVTLLVILVAEKSNWQVAQRHYRQQRRKLPTRYPHRKLLGYYKGAGVTKENWDVHVICVLGHSPVSGPHVLKHHLRSLPIDYLSLRSMHFRIFHCVLAHHCMV